MKTFRKYFIEFFGVALSVILIYSIGMSFGLLVRKTDFTSQCVIFSCGLISAGMYILVYYGLSNKNEAHLNPIITLAKMFSLDTKFSEGILHIVSQIAGAIVGSCFVGALFKISGKLDQSKVHYLSEVSPEYSRGYMLPTLDGLKYTDKPIVCAVVMEIVISFIMVLVVLSVTNKKNRKKYAGVVVGMAIALAYFQSILLTRSFANPAMVIGSIIMNLISGTMYDANNLWIFLGMPFIGAVLAAIVYNLFIHSVRKRNAIEAFGAECIAMIIYVALAANCIMQFTHYSSFRLYLGTNATIASYIVIGLICAILYICLYHIFESITDVQLNPIVSIALWIDKKISFLKAFTNIIAQLIGAILGINILYRFRVEYIGLNDGTTNWTCECMEEMEYGALANIVSNWKIALLFEIFLAAVLIAFVLHAYKNMNQVKSLFIGMAIAMVYFIDSLFNIMTVNPAKSIASVILNQQKEMLMSKNVLEDLWIFVVGPIVGAVLVAVVHRILEKRRKGGVTNEE